MMANILIFLDPILSAQVPKFSNTSNYFYQNVYQHKSLVATKYP